MTVFSSAVRGKLSLFSARRSPPRVIASAGVETYEGIPRMPALFGRQGGPRQRWDRDGGYPATGGATLVTWLAVEADGGALAALLPAGFALARPLLVVEAISLSNLPWLAGRGYEMLLVSTPVTYGAHAGRLELVTWEDRPDAIISGREELGWNKVYADTMTRYSGDDGRTVRYLAAWEGTTFFEMEVRLKRTPAPPGAWRDGILMHYRVFPRTGAWGELDVEQVTGHTATAPVSSIRSLQSGTGSIRFVPAGFDQLPTLQHIVGRLASVELGDVVDAGQARSASWSDVHDIRILGADGEVW